jgi:hypothetical protein
MPHYLEADRTTVATGPWYPVHVERSADNWDIGSAGYAKDPETTVVQYPDQTGMEAADRSLGFNVALGAAQLAHSVEVVFTERGQ